MSKNYLTYPCKVMRISQNYNGRTSHYPHTVGYPKDYPIDEACTDTGREWFYCPCDKMKVKRVYGVGARGTNTIWLESTSKVYFADGTSGFVTMLITHPNDDDLKKIKVGKTYTRGQKICREGIDGATGNHLHISVGKGTFKGNGWTENSKRKFVLTTMGGTYKPEKLFYIDPDFTKVISSGGLTFEELPNEYSVGKYKVTEAEVLRVRTTASTEKPYKKFAKLTKTAQKKILALTDGVETDGYVKNLTFTVTKVSKNWGKTASGWVCLDYCEKI